jgi:hypothetical protein
MHIECLFSVLAIEENTHHGEDCMEVHTDNNTDGKGLTFNKSPVFNLLVMPPFEEQGYIALHMLVCISGESIYR